MMPDESYQRPLLPPGIYSLTVSEVEPRVSRGGTDYLAVTFLWKGTDRKVFDNFVDHEQASWKFQQLGIERASELVNLIGSTFRVQLDHESWLRGSRELIRSYLAKEVE